MNICLVPKLSTPFRDIDAYNDFNRTGGLHLNLMLNEMTKRRDPGILACRFEHKNSQVLRLHVIT